MRGFSIALFLSLALTVSAAGPWQQVASFAGAGRHRSEAFSIGNKGYYGLGHYNSIVNYAQSDIWEYDPATDSWTQKADFGGGQRYHAASFTIGGKAYVGTGRLPSGQLFNDFWSYDPTTNTWLPIANIPGDARRGAVGFSVGSFGYVGCGQTSNMGQNNFYRYDPALNSWSQVASFPGQARVSAVAFSIDDKGYVGTGSDSPGVGNDFWEYKPSTNQWTQKASVGTQPREAACGFAAGGKGYIVTGCIFMTEENFSDAWEFDPLLNTWKQIYDFPGTKRRYMEAFSIGTKAFVVGGTNGINFTDTWLFDPMLTGLAQVEDEEILAYPNPATTEARLLIPSEFSGNSGSARLAVYDMSGRKVFEDVTTSSEFILKQEQIGKGTFFCRVENAEGRSKTVRVVFL